MTKRWSRSTRPRQARPSHHMLPAAAALTITGVLIGGAGTIIQFDATTNGSADYAVEYDPADYSPPDRDAQRNRVSRDATAHDETAPAAQPQPQPVSSPSARVVVTSGSCKAAFHDEPQGTASGEWFDPNTLTAAHKSLPFNTTVRVINVANGKSVDVRINDRGPYISGRCLDLSRAAFAAIANLNTGVINVRYEVLAADTT